MRPLTFVTRAARRPAARSFAAHAGALAGKSAAEIAQIELQTTRERVTVGDVFRIRMGDAGRIVIEGGAERLDRVGMGLNAGELLVEGDVGVEAGRAMSGGTLTIRGNAGPFAASGMKGGTIEVAGDVGERLAGPLAGETFGHARRRRACARATRARARATGCGAASC